MRNTVAQHKQIMRFMPLVFGFFLARFPAGLFVYWVTSNLITLCQNYLIYRRVAQAPPPRQTPLHPPKIPPRKDRERTSRQPRNTPRAR
jgi:YidC/Oxa1 family membrane protein insertase